MKGWFICLLIVLSVSCGTSTSPAVEQAVASPPSPAPRDTVYVEAPVLNEERIRELEEDVAYWKRVADSTNTVIPYADYANARRMEKIRYYISICERNANNKKFFYGWIRRTMSEI